MSDALGRADSTSPQQLFPGGGATGTAVPDVVTIFPPEDGDLDLAEYPPIVLAQQDLANLTRGAKEEEVNVVVDEEMEDQVVELLGSNANMGFALQDMDLPFLVFHVRNMKRFFRFELTVEDSEGDSYSISASNRQTVVRAKRDSCSLPIRLSPGWNRLCLNLSDICTKAFGVDYKLTTQLRVFASCRIWRLFFQDKNYADNELPRHLRVIDDDQPLDDDENQ